ncbi:hypothetical protein TrVE_jg13537 [Triparma verrucosa]|uniref:C2 domain-containing protein n=1 Tax=Triparma verrucosa TaxID=1606542 RepID=A0A9W7FIS3_9STRA|nr:hypothetical protein TrVE_jg13537 [Triparma verrucosa]
MTIKYRRRSSGMFRSLKTGGTAERIREKQMGDKKQIHRPIARLKISVPLGKNLRSRDLGLPGNAYCTVSYTPDPLDDKDSQTYEIGSTATSKTTINPVWNSRPRISHRRLHSVMTDLSSAIGSNLSLLKKTVSSSAPTPSKSTHRPRPLLSSSTSKWGSDYVFTYPLLQPSTSTHLLPWSTHRGSILIRVYFSNVFNSLMDDCLGQVIIPVKDLVSNEREGGEQVEIQGFFRVTSVGKEGGVERLFNSHLRKRTRTSSEDMRSVNSVNSDNPGSTDDSLGDPPDVAHSSVNELLPQILVRTQLTLSSPSLPVSSLEREASLTISRELQTFSKKSTDENIIGSSISSVRGAMQNAKWIQNLLTSSCEIIESSFNIISWVDPKKSLIVYLGVSFIWLCLIFIKTRYLILVAGMHQFISGGLRRFKVNRRGYKSEERGERDEKVGVGNPVTNFIARVPNDEDLRRYYFYENFRMGQIEKERIEEKRRRARLRTIWNSKFQARIGVREDTRWVQGCFLVLQSHRVSWWKNEREFDDGEECLAQVHWGGHSGLAGLSPLDLRTLSKEEVERSSAIFGRGGGRTVGTEGGVLEEEEDGRGPMGAQQAKRLFLFESAEIKETFENQVLQCIEGSAKMD